MPRRYIVLCEGDNDQKFIEIITSNRGMSSYCPDRSIIESNQRGESKVITEFLCKIGKYKHLQALIKDEGGNQRCFGTFKELLKNPKLLSKVIVILDDDGHRDVWERKIKEISCDNFKEIGKNSYLSKYDYNVLLIPQSLERQIQEKTGKTLDMLGSREDKNEVIKEFARMNVTWFEELHAFFRDTTTIG